MNWDAIDEGPYSLGVVAIRWWIIFKVLQDSTPKVSCSDTLVDSGGQKLPGRGQILGHVSRHIPEPIGCRLPRDQK